MKHKFWHRDIVTNKTYDPDKPYYTSPEGNLLLIERDEDYIKEKFGTGKKLQEHFDSIRFNSNLRRNYPMNSGVWMWRDFILPDFPIEAIVSLNEGQTDLFEAPKWLLNEIGLKNLLIKEEGQNPSESFKDRGMTVAISDTRRLQIEKPELGINGVSCASTGDTSAAAAQYSAYVQNVLKCLVLLPYEKISDAQLFQAQAYGAMVRAVKSPDGFDGCMRVIAEFAGNHPEYVLVNSKNDMRLVGQETIALEILQDLNWQAPDWIAIPVGNGGNLTALLNSLKRAKEFELIDKLPNIIVGQAEVSDTLVRWSESNYQNYKPREFKESLASASNINDPVSFPRIKTLYENFNIKYYRSNEKEISEVWTKFMRGGASICPQTALALNGVIKARSENVIKENETVVAISTASAIKFSEGGIESLKQEDNPNKNPYIVVDDNLESLEKSL